MAFYLYYIGFQTNTKRLQDYLAFKEKYSQNLRNLDKTLKG
jgi:hypothetical protein